MGTLNLGPTGEPFIGDTGSGGTQGLVPAPPAGSAAEGEYLSAGGGWSVPAGGSGGSSGVSSVTGTTPIASSGGANPVISLNSSGVAAGTYTSTNLTVNAKGLITAASSGSPGGVTAVSASAPLASTGGATPNITLSTSGVSAASYTYATIGVSAQGIVTSAASGTAPLTSLTVSGPLSSTGGLTPIVTMSTSGVTAGSYTYSALTVNNQGLITAAANGTAPVTAITVSSPITSTGGSTPNLALSTSGVTAASYTNTSLTVNAQGIITSASNGSFGGITSVTASSPLSATGGANPIITLNTSGVTATSYTYATVGVSSQGIVTSAASGVAPVTDISVSSPLTTTGGVTPTLALSTSGVTAASYTSANVTVDAYGRVTAASNGGGAGVSSVTASSPLTSTGGGTPNLALSTSGVTAGNYTYATVGVTALGLVTSASSGANPVLLSGSTMSGALILSGDPTQALGAVTKQYADAISAGIDLKDACYAATTPSAGDLGATYNNGVSGVGATLTGGSNVLFTLDGTSPALNSRVLVKNQTDNSTNGIYTLSTQGVVGVSPWVLMRSADYNTPAQIAAGDLVPITNGTVNASSSWLETATVTAIGSGNPITFTQFTFANPVVSVTASSPLSSTGGVNPNVYLNLSAGQVPIGTSGGAIGATLTQGTGIAITSSSGSITIASSLNSGNTLPVSSGGTGNNTFGSGNFLVGNGTGSIQQVALIAGSGISITPNDPSSGDTTIAATGNGNYVNQTNYSAGALVANTVYLANSGGTTTQWYMPITGFNAGDYIEIQGSSSPGWSIDTQNGYSQQFIFGNQVSTIGTGGIIESTNQYDCVKLRCISPGSSGTFSVISNVGTLAIG